jgi:hypothetical protein
MAAQRTFPSCRVNTSNETDRELHRSRNALLTTLLPSLQLSGIELFRINEGLVERKLRNIQSSKNSPWVNDHRLQEIIRVQVESSSFKSPANHWNNNTFVGR